KLPKEYRSKFTWRKLAGLLQRAPARHALVRQMALRQVDSRVCGGLGILSVICHDYAQFTFGQGENMAKSNLRLVTPDSELRTVGLRRRSNRDMGREREHLTELEVERLIKVAKGNRRGHRDATMILIGFRHGLRVSELCELKWSSIAFETGTMHVRRVKGGEAATHPLLGGELRALRELKRQSGSPFVFASERGGPFTPSGFAKLLARAGDEAKIGFKVHPHMLRHACGYALANKGIFARMA